MKTDKKTIRKVFESNTEKNEVHITSDGNKFFEPAHAKSHAKTLEDTSITTITREEAMVDESDEDRLQTIEERQEQIKLILEQYKPEWEALEAEKQEILDRLENSEAAAEAMRKSQEQAEALAKEEAERKAAEEAEAKAKQEAEAKAKEEADAAAAEAKKKEEEEAAAAAAKASKNNKK